MNDKPPPVGGLTAENPGMNLAQLPFSDRNDLVDRVARGRLLAYLLAVAMTVGSTIVAPSSRSGALLVVMLAAGLVPLVRRSTAVDHLALAFKIDAFAILILWWIFGPVAGLGVGLFLIAALAGVVLPARTAFPVGVAVVFSEFAQIPLHLLIESFPDLPLLHASGQVVAMVDFLAASAVRLAALVASVFLFRSVGASIRSYQRELRTSEESFRGAFEGAPMGVGLVDCAGTILKANDRLQRVLPTLVGATNMTVLEDGRSDSVCALLKAVLNDEKASGYVGVEPIPGRFARVWVSAIRDENGAFVHAVIHAEDVTEEVAASIRLEQLVKSKDEFVAAISHELRTPLTAVVGFSEVLKEALGDLDAETVAEMVGDIARESSEVASIVDDLLVIARADIGRVTLLPERVSVAAQVRQVTQNLALVGRSLAIDVGDASVNVDPVRFRQVLRNLVSNAVRYGGEKITISETRRDTWQVVTVSDDGVGVDGVDSDRIFEAYERANDRPSQPASVGLGLAVARSLARAMGGDITYSRSMGFTNFELTVPADPDQAMAS